MKYYLTLISVFFLFTAKAQTINQPKVEFSNSGIYHIDKITLADTATIVDLKVLFLPNWWTMFSDKAYLEDSKSGEKYPVKAIQGASFNTKLWTPKSGDTLVRLIFPRLGNEVKSVNYSDDGKIYVYGISTREKSSTKKEASIPKEIQKWLKQQTTAKRANPKGFFTSDSIKIVGYIKGYDKRASFASGIIYHKNSISNEDFPTTVRIYEDGRFECSMLGIHPIWSYISFQHQILDFYAEPGTTTGIILDWNEFLLADRYRDRRYEFKNIEYMGVHKLVNEQLAAIEIIRPEYNRLDGYRKTQKPDEFKNEQLKNWQSARKKVDSAMLVKQTSDKVKNLLENQVDLVYANFLFDYESQRNYYQQQEPNNEILKLPMPENYFDFLNQIDLNDHTLLVSNEFSTLINRFEFSAVFDRQILYNRKKSIDFQKLDSAYIAKFKKTNLIYDIGKLRTLVSHFRFSQHKDQPFTEEVAALSKTIQDLFVISEMNRMYDKYKVGSVAYDLPNTAAAAVFKKIINPLKGKILIVDFWAQWCGPCRSGIESSLDLRKKYKNNPDFDFIYVTDSESTESAFYDEYIKTNMMTNTHRIKADEYLALRELFKFNGIPRYVLVNAEGKIQDDNFQSYNLQREFAKYFPEKFSAGYWK